MATFVILNILSPFWSWTQLIPTIWLMISSFSNYEKNLTVTFCHYVGHCSKVIWNSYLVFMDENYTFFFLSLSLSLATSAYQTSKSSLFRCCRYSDVRFSDLHCIWYGPQMSTIPGTFWRLPGMGWTCQSRMNRPHFNFF